MVKLKTKIIWIAVSVAIFTGVWTGVFIQDKISAQTRGNNLLKKLENDFPLSLPQDVTCKRVISDGFTGIDTYAYYEINDKNFAWKNDKGDEWKSIYTSFDEDFCNHFGFLMKNCEPNLNKGYEYSYFAKDSRWVYILYVPEDNALAVGVCVD